MDDLVSKKYKTERLFIIILCITAMVRVFLLNAAFPVFNPVDEVQHFDTIVRYAEGDVYKSGKPDYSLNLWSAKMQILYGTPEYLHQELKDTLPIFRKMNRPGADAIVDSLRQGVADSLPNYEIHSPPLYYFVAGEWLNIGKHLLSNDGFLLYWLRFMNVFYYGLLLWLTYVFCKDLYPEDTTVRIGVPMLLSVLPNTIFYSINSDVFSPLFCLLAIFFTLRICLRQQTIPYYAVTGCAIASTILVKLTNMPTFAVCIGLVIIQLVRFIANKQMKRHLWHVTALFIALLAPVSLWMGWNVTALGNLFGTDDKIKYLGWTRKPFLEWFDHPIFSIGGLKATADNFHMLIYTVWRGDLLDWPGWLDGFFTLSSIVFILAVIIDLWTTHGKFKYRDSWLNLCFLAIIVMYIGFIIVSSIQFDFGKCFSPSRANPYFNKGRLIIGCLIPFLILYVKGLEYILVKIKLKINPLYVISAICLVIFVITPIVTFNTFSSSWNWYHYFM